MIANDLVPLRVLDPSGSWQLCRFPLIGHGTVFIRVTAASLVPRDAISGEAAPLAWTIRVMRLIRCIPVHQNNRTAFINHAIFPNPGTGVAGGGRVTNAWAGGSCHSGAGPPWARVRGGGRAFVPIIPLWRTRKAEPSNWAPTGPR